jgi:hypothetical protein
MSDAANRAHFRGARRFVALADQSLQVSGGHVGFDFAGSRFSAHGQGWIAGCRDALGTPLPIGRLRHKSD